MKTLSKASVKSTRAVALIIVLAMLVLLSGLIVAFMSTVTTEHAATESFSNATTARQLADNTTNFVIGQIREATTLYTEKGTWASQPGAIRVFMGKQTTNQIKLGSEGGAADWRADEEAASSPAPKTQVSLLPPPSCMETTGELASVETRVRAPGRTM